MGESSSPAGIKTTLPSPCCSTDLGVKRLELEDAHLIWEQMVS